MDLVGDILAELDDIPTSPKHQQQQPGQKQPLIPSSSSSSAQSAVRPPHHPRTNSQPSLANAHTKHAHTQSASHSSSKQTQHAAKRASLPGSKPDFHSSINDLLDHLDLDDEPKPSSHSRPQVSALSTSPPAPRTSTSGTSAAQPKPKCLGIYLGGTKQQHGRNGAVIGQLMCCDALRCTKCDLGVITFRDRAWKSDCDYLFFRNNYPTEAKLAAGQREEPGTCAYSCQCSWKSVRGDDAVRVDSYAGDLSWVCKGHAMPFKP
ncbi:retinal maintenance-domain-containing protein [Dunaliella salina]|uniref:Cilia- and flagella-associated protein 418 n=1 Tax=Dunaliella salina TaxID=3046 RepID=A0ABZ3KQ08_DUNSA|nr:retinal maintenance-domain-containing protein [Dunaliella salina]|eukprot:KAF5831256.1 retinal maintenance-domain-containing protein [Dunaliella salina]